MLNLEQLANELGKLISEVVALSRNYEKATEDIQVLHAQVEEQAKNLKSASDEIVERAALVKKYEDVAAVMTDIAKQKDGIEASQAKLDDERAAFELEKSQTLGELNQQLAEVKKDRELLAHAKAALDERALNLKQEILDELTAKIK